MTETERFVMDRLHEKGFKVLTRGWPDFLAIRDDGVVLFIEVKRSDQPRIGSPDQETVMLALERVYRREVSPTFGVIRPQDLKELDLRIHLCAADAQTLNLSSNDSSNERPTSPTAIQ
jgi:Holliday junction resolvase